MSPERSKPRALVIGGSLAGLCAGVCLRTAGWRVSIFERSSPQMKMGLHLRDYGIRVVTNRSFPASSFEQPYPDWFLFNVPIGVCRQTTVLFFKVGFQMPTKGPPMTMVGRTMPFPPRTVFRACSGFSMTLRSV